MPILGARSGFKTARDLIICMAGLTGCFVHLLTAEGDIKIEVLIFFGGLATSPYVISKDEKR